MATLLRHARRLAASGAINARASTPASEGAAASLAASTATAAHRRFVMTSRRAHATAGAAVAADDEHLLQSVVKVFTVHSSPNYFQPWQNKPQRETSGSGVVVTAPVPGGVGILTNAHVVADQTFVQVRRHGSSVKHRARVHAVGHACDLAVLAVPNRPAHVRLAQQRQELVTADNKNLLHCVLLKIFLTKRQDVLHPVLYVASDFYAYETLLATFVALVLP